MCPDPSRRILVRAATPAAGDAIRERLAEFGYEPETSAEAEVRAVLVDLRHGKAALRDRAPGGRIVGVVDRATADEVLAFVQAGVETFLAWPFDAEALEGALTRLESLPEPSGDAPAARGDAEAQILLIEDDPLMRAIVATLLAQRGHTCIGGEHGRRGPDGGAESL